MTKKFGGYMDKTLPTKRDLIESYDERLKSLTNAISQVAQMGARTDQQLQQRLIGLSTMLGDVATDLRALLRVLESTGFSTKDHEAMVEKIQIEDFEAAVAMEDSGKNLINMEGPSSLGQYIVIKMEAFQPDTIVVHPVDPKAEGAVPTILPNPLKGEKIEQFSKLRSRVQIGSGNLHPLLESELVGLKVGELKEFDFVMPEQLPDKAFAGKVVKFKVEVLDLKQETPPAIKVEAPAPTVEVAQPVLESTEEVKTE